MVYLWHVYEFSRLVYEREEHNMADSLATAAGEGIEVELKGKTYKIMPITIGDLAEFEGYIRGKRLKEAMVAADSLPPEDKIKVITEMCSKGLSETDVTDEMNKLDGVRFLLWKALSRTDPNMKLDGVNDLVDMSNINVISSIVQSIGGMDPDEVPPTEEEAGSPLDGTTPSPS